MEIEKLRHLVEHWIEHNEEHVSKYREWADRIKPLNPEISEIILEAVEHFEKGNKVLKKLEGRI